MKAKKRQGNKKIIIFIPAYEHTKTLPSVLDRIPDSIKEKVGEIVVIDDASSDNTYLLAKGYKLEKGLDKLSVYRNNSNRGYGGNQKVGYRYAIDRGYDIVIMLHGDGQYAPELLPDLLKPLEDDGADMVFGSRMRGEPLRGGMPIYKYLGNRFLTAFENMFLGMNLSEFHSGYRLYSCHALKRIPFELNSNDFHFDTEIIIQFREAGLRIVEMPIPTFYGEEISNVRVIKYGINVMKSVFEYRLHKRGMIDVPKYKIRSNSVGDKAVKKK